MTKTTALCCTAAAAFLMTYSCSNRKEVETKSEPSAPANAKPDKSAAPSATAPGDTSSHPSLSSLASVEVDKDGMKFIRTADIKFQVPDVARATYDMEDITAHYGGFVTYTDLHSTVNRSEVLPISADSALDVTYYTVQNDITLRLPNTRMDSALKEMSTLVDFLDHRTIIADEVSGRLLSNEMSAQRNSDYEKRMNKYADDKQVKREDIASVTDKALAGREQADNAKLANMSLNNQIKYSTLHFVVYQRETVRKVKVANETNIARYQPSLVIQIWEAMVSGWEVLSYVVVFLVQCWPLLLIGGSAWVIYRRRKSK